MRNSAAFGVCGGALAVLLALVSSAAADVWLSCWPNTGVPTQNPIQSPIPTATGCYCGLIGGPTVREAS